MNRLAGKKKWIVLVCFIILISWYMYNSLFIVFYYNTKIDVAGVKLLQTEVEVKNNKIITDMKETYNPRKGYKSPNLEIYFGDYGVFDGKLESISIYSPKYSIIGIKVGDDWKEAAGKLRKSGFKEKSASFYKGCLRVDLLGWGSEDKIDEILIRVQNRFNISLVKSRD